MPHCSASATMATLSARSPVGLTSNVFRQSRAVAPAGLPLLRKAAAPAARSVATAAMSGLPLHTRAGAVHVAHKPVGRRVLDVKAQAAATPAPAKAPEFKWGANMRDLAICVGIATLLWFIPPPAGVTQKAWHLLAVFIGTIVGIITTPLPLGAVAVLGLGAAMLTKVLTFAEAFSAFASEIP